MLSAPLGQVGVDPFAAFLGEVKVRRLVLDELGLRLRVAADGSLSIAAAGDEAAAPIALPGGGSGLESLNLADPGAGGRGGDGRGRARRSTGSPSPTRVSRSTTRRPAARSPTAISASCSIASGAEASARMTATGPAGRWKMEARAAVGDEPKPRARGPRRQPRGPRDVRQEAAPPVRRGADRLQVRFADRARGWDPDPHRSVHDGRGNRAAQQSRRPAVPPRRGVGRDRVGRRGQAARHRELRRSRRRHALQRLGLGRAAVRRRRTLGAGASKPGTLASGRSGAARGPSRSTPSPPSSGFSRSSRASSSTPSRPGVRPSDGALTAEIAPDGDREFAEAPAGPAAERHRGRRSVVAAVHHPDVRDWASHNIHGGKLEGVMVADWSADDLDAMEHKRAVAPDSVHGTLRHPCDRRRPPAGPAADGLGRRRRVVHRPRIQAPRPGRATMDLTPTRRIFADNLAFEIPDTSPRPIIDGSGPGASERNRRRARRPAQPGAPAQAGGNRDRPRDGQGAGGGRSGARPQARQDRQARGHAVPREPASCRA